MLNMEATCELRCRSDQHRQAEGAGGVLDQEGEWGGLHRQVCRVYVRAVVRAYRGDRCRSRIEYLSVL